MKSCLDSVKKNSYRILFGISLSSFLLVVICSICLGKWALLKDIGLPLAALMFSSGQLLLDEKKHEFDIQKYQQQRKDQYWDKRFAYAGRLQDLVEMILSFFMEDIGPDYSKDTKLGKIYIALNDLEFGGKVLFGASGIDQKIVEIREEFEKIKEDTIRLKTLALSQSQDERTNRCNISKDIETSKWGEIVKIHDLCKEIIVSSLRQEIGEN